MKIENINIVAIWPLLVGTALGVVYMFNTFAKAEDMKKLDVEMKQQSLAIQTQIAYGQYYDRLDDYDEAMDEENNALAKEYKRQMERLAAKICEDDPEWERCDDEAE